MSSKLSMIKNLTVVFVVLALTCGAYAQSGQQLVDQLRGKAEAPSRSAEQLAQAYQEAVEYLLPLMSAEDIGSRYDPQIALQDMGSYAARPGAEAQREALARVLCTTVETAEMPATVRNWFVLQIERIGKAESVETLTNLLSNQDKELRDYARRALEKNPSRAASQSITRTGKEATDPVWKNALSHSMREQSHMPATSSSRAAVESEIRALTTALKRGTISPGHISAAQTLIGFAGDFVKQQEFDQAMSIYVELNSWAIEQGKQAGQDEGVFFVRAASLNGIAMCDSQRAVEVVVEAMQSDNPKVRSVAVKAARNAQTKDATQTLTKMLPGLDPYYQKQVLGLIGDRGDLSSVKPVQAVLNSEDESVKLAAIDALTRVGGDEAAASLFEVAAGQGAAAKAARDGLAVMVGPAVEGVIKAKAASRDANSRVAAIGLLGERRASGAVESLLIYAADADQNISAAAFKALAAAAGPGDVTTLASLLAGTGGNQARQNAVATLKSVLAKCNDKDASAAIIVKQMDASQPQARLALLTTLSAVGGPAALKAVTQAAQSSDEALREAGIRTLGDWPDYDAAQVLLGIASSQQTSLTHHVLAIRAAVRLIKAGTDAPLSDRADLCFSALASARRDEEKKQVISAMGTVPDKKVAERLMELVKSEGLKIEAGLAAVELAGNMARTDRQAAQDLAQKVRELNLSNEINRRADEMMKGRQRRR